MAEVAYVLLVDGISRVFTTTEEVTDLDVQGWGFETAYAGLELPDRLPVAVDIRTGQLTSSTASFSINDIDGTLPQLFGASLDTMEPLLTRIEPGDVAPSSTWGKHVGIECMGPNGERRQYSCVPTWNVGLAHTAESQNYASQMGASPVSTLPVVWAGRRVCLHRLVRTSGAWSDLTDATVRNETRIWFGTLTGSGEVDSHTWTLSGHGPESWGMGTLGANISELPFNIRDIECSLNEDANEHYILGNLEIGSLFANTTDYLFVTDYLDTTSLLGATTYDDFVTGFATFLAGIAADNSLGAAYDSYGNSGIRYSTDPGNDGVQMRWDRDANGYVVGANSALTAYLRVEAHEKFWKALGFDPATQNPSVDPVETPEKYGRFFRNPWSQEGFWIGRFYSADLFAVREADLGGTEVVANEHLVNNGQWMTWRPIYAGGANFFDLTKSTQEFGLDNLTDTYLPSSTAFPLPADPSDPTSPYNISGVGDVTHCGLVAITGPYRDLTVPDAEVKTITIPARVAWRQNSNGEVATGSGFARFVVWGWPDPRLFGMTDKQPSTWGSNRVPPEEGGVPLTMRPLLALEHEATGSDRVPYVLARLLASTGTSSGWYSDAGLTTPGYGPLGLYQDVGVNDLGIAAIGDLGFGKHTDAETTTLGMGVPAEMISASATEQTSFEAAIELATNKTQHCKAAFGKVASAREVVGSLLAPSGLCMSLAGGKFGIFDPFEFKPLLGNGVINVESLAGKPGEPLSSIPTQQLRKWAPIDRVELNARLDPITGKFGRTETTRSSDPSALYRSQSLIHKVDGSHLMDPTIGGEIWIDDYRERWRQITKFWSKQHFEAEFALPARRAHEFWPGAIVEVTNPFLLNPATAGYEVVNAPGYVISRNYDAKTETIRVTCLVSGGTLLLYAPSALALGDDSYDSTNHRIFVQDDYLGIRGNTGTLDVDGFIEPDFSTAGGDADIEVFSFNGVTWVGGIYGTVSSIDQTPGSSYIQLDGPLTGATWYRDMYHLVVLREADNQGAAWALSVYAPIGDKDGNYTGSTKTHQFKD